MIHILNNVFLQIFSCKPSKLYSKRPTSKKLIRCLLSRLDKWNRSFLISPASQRDTLFLQKWTPSLFCFWFCSGLLGCWWFTREEYIEFPHPPIPLFSRMCISEKISQAQWQRSLLYPTQQKDIYWRIQKPCRIIGETKETDDAGFLRNTVRATLKNQATVGAAVSSTTWYLVLRFCTSSRATANSGRLYYQKTLTTASHSRATLCELQAESASQMPHSCLWPSKAIRQSLRALSLLGLLAQVAESGARTWYHFWLWLTGPQSHWGLQPQGNPRHEEFASQSLEFREAHRRQLESFISTKRVRKSSLGREQ